MSESTVAVTGATGFIGQLLVHSLIKNGCKVRALTRTPRISDESIEWIMGDLNDQIALQSLVKVFPQLFIVQAWFVAALLKNSRIPM